MEMKIKQVSIVFQNYWNPGCQVYFFHIKYDFGNEIPEFFVPDIDLLQSVTLIGYAAKQTTIMESPLHSF